MYSNSPIEVAGCSSSAPVDARAANVTSQCIVTNNIATTSKQSEEKLESVECMTGTSGNSKINPECNNGPVKKDLPTDRVIVTQLVEAFEEIGVDASNWATGISKISKLVKTMTPENTYETVQLLIKLKFIEKFHEYLESNNIVSLDKFISENESKSKNCWPTMKRFFTITWIACDESVNFCQNVLTSDVFQFFIENLKALASCRYEIEDSKLFIVKACLGIAHNICRHLPNSKWRLRMAGLITAIKPFLGSIVPMVKLKTLITLSYILSEVENEMICSDDDNFIFIFEVLSNSLKADDHRSIKYGMSAEEVLKGVANLAINDENKLRIVRTGGLLMYETILQSGTIEEIKVTITTLWSLAFHHYNKNKICGMPHIMKRLCELQQHSNDEISHAARGTFWELENSSRASIGKTLSTTSSTDKNPNLPHIMISYQWDSQHSMLKIKDKLKAAGYKVWMDVEHMTGSTLEAMALAVERAAVVLVCMSQKYKDSPNCRTEAEYVYRLRKDIIPLRLQHEYVPDGWLGILVGTRLYFDIYTETLLHAQLPRLVKELCERGKLSNLTDLTDNAVEDKIVPQRMISREAVPVFDMESPTTANQSKSVVGAVSSWSCQDVQNWLTSNTLTKNQMQMFANIDGALLQELCEIQSTAPEYFQKMLRTDFSLSVYDALKISSIIRKL